MKRPVLTLTFSSSSRSRDTQIGNSCGWLLTNGMGLDLQRFCKNDMEMICYSAGAGIVRSHEVIESRSNCATARVSLQP